MTNLTACETDVRRREASQRYTKDHVPSTYPYDSTVSFASASTAIVSLKAWENMGFAWGIVGGGQASIRKAESIAILHLASA